jgi:membrane fusion protein (multidrug efflux system)
MGKKENNGEQPAEKQGERNRNMARESSSTNGVKKSLIIFAIIAVAVIAGGFFLYWYYRIHPFVKTDNANIAGNRYSISAKIPGKLSELLFEEGASVGQNELIARLDDSDLKAQADQAQANIAYLNHSAELARVSLELARSDFNRDEVQYRNNIISKEQYDHSQKAFQMAEVKLQMALAQVKSAQAQLQVIRTQLDNTRLWSPSSGSVAKKWVSVGDVIQPGQPVYTIFDLDNLWIEANYKETEIASITPGDQVDVSVDAYPHLQVKGKVLSVGSAAAYEFALIPPSNASGNFTKVVQRIPVKISLENLDAHAGSPRLVPGMSVTVRVRVW